MRPTAGPMLLVAFALLTIAVEWSVSGHTIQMFITVYPKLNRSVEYIHFILCLYVSM